MCVCVCVYMHICVYTKTAGEKNTDILFLK